MLGTLHGAYDNIQNPSLSSSCSSVRLSHVVLSDMARNGTGHEIPPHVLYASPVPLNAPDEGRGRGQSLPLSLIVHVISYVSLVSHLSNHADNVGID